MKVTFVHLGRENLGIESLSAVLKKAGHQVSLASDPGLFSREDNVFCLPALEKVFSRRRRIIEMIEEIKPGLVAFSVYTTNYQWASGLAKEIKEKFKLPVLFGGIHPTLVPDEVIRHEFIDFLIAGEGEFAMLELLQALEDKSLFSGIKNLWYKEDNLIRRNELRSPIKDLDTLPFPDKELFEDEVCYRDDYMIMVSRGCPCSCSYCCESYMHNIYKGKYLRRRSVDSVMKELAQAKAKYNFREVMFFDAILFADKDWLKEFLGRYKKEIGVPFRCTGHVLFFNDEVAKILKDSGCYCIDFGVQTFNQKIRKEFLNRPESNAQIKAAFDTCDRAKIRYDIDLMFGLPDVDEEDYKLPIEFLKDNRYLNRLKCYALSYYPKLAIIDKCRESGRLQDEDIKNIEKGFIGDWFHNDSITDAEHKRWKENFTRLYKIYPLVPKSIMDKIIKGNWYKRFYLIPNFIIVFLQLAAGISTRDYRFKIYINNYLRQLSRILKRKPA